MWITQCDDDTDDNFIFYSATQIRIVKWKEKLSWIICKLDLKNASQS